MNREGKYLINPSQLSQVKVNVPNAFLSAGINVVLVQTAAGTVNVGLAHKFDIGSLKPIDDLGKIFQIKKIISGPEARKEKRESRERFQNFIFNMMVEKCIRTNDLVVRNGLDTELEKYASVIDYLEYNESVVLASAKTCDLDKFLVNFLIDQMDRIHSAVMSYLASYVTSQETEKIAFKEFLIENGVTDWLYTKIAQNKVELQRDQAIWTLFFKASLEKSFTITMLETQHVKIQEAHIGFPGFEDLVKYCEKVMGLVKDPKDDSLKKVKMFLFPKGMEYDLLQKQIIAARTPLDTTEFREYSKIWNLSRLGLLGIANPDGSREDLLKFLYKIDISDDEKIDIPSAMKEKKPDDKSGLVNGDKKSVLKFFQHVGIPARLTDQVLDLADYIFPPDEVEEKTEDGAESTKQVPFQGEIGKVLRSEYHFTPAKRERKPFKHYIRADRNRDKFEEFEKSPYYVRNLAFDIKGPKLRGSGTALTKKSLDLLKVIKKKEEVVYLHTTVENFLSGFKLPEMMDLAAEEIYNQLRSKAYLDYEDDNDNDEVGKPEETSFEDL